MSSWQLTSDKMEGYIIVVYHNDWLINIQIVTEKPLKEKQYEYLLLRIRINEYTLRNVGIPGFKIVPHIPRQNIPANEKIAMFCKKYMEHYQGLKYKADGRDGGMINNYDITDELLDTYFKSESFNFKNKHSIRNLITYFNELRAEHAGLTKNEFPNYYCSELYDYLSQLQRKKYQDHLAINNGIVVTQATK